MVVVAGVSIGMMIRIPKDLYQPLNYQTLKVPDVRACCGGLVGLVGVAVGRFRVVLVAIVTLGVVVVRGARRGRPGAPPTWKTIPSTSALMSLKAKASHTQSDLFPEQDIGQRRV